jgi:hypothetical protein
MLRNIRRIIDVDCDNNYNEGAVSYRIFFKELMDDITNLFPGDIIKMTTNNEIFEIHRFYHLVYKYDEKLHD